MPERRGPIYALLKKLFCKNNGAVTGVSNSEVWSMPQGQSNRIAKHLEALGMKVTKLRDDWNQILKLHVGQMTRAQQDMVDKVKIAPGTVGVQVLQVAEPARDAFAMTIESHKPICQADLQTSPKEQAPSAVVLPISSSKSITLERVGHSTDERGCAWDGIVAETGESALLMRWNDG